MPSYNFQKEVKVYVVYDNTRYTIDVSAIDFDQTFAEKSYNQRTLHFQRNLFEASVINKANPATFSFTMPLLKDTDLKIVFDLLVDYQSTQINLKSFDLYVATATDVFKLEECVITNGSFVIERSQPLSIEIEGEASRVTRGQTLTGSLQSRSATKTHTIPQKLIVTIGGATIPNIVSLTLELQNEINWTPYSTVNGAISASTPDTSMYPSSFSLSKKILSGSITAYLTNVNASEAQTWNDSAQIQIKAGNGLSTDSFRGFNFGPATCSYTNRASTGDIFLHSYDWRMIENPSNLANELQYITD